ncbi:MAG TPA: AsmA family protein, partial [Nitrospirota bacterium]
MKKTLIIISVVFVVLLAAIEVYVQSDDFGDRIRPFVVGPLKEAFGEGASIGRVRANFIPLFLEARDIVVPDERGNPIIAIHKIRAYLNPLPLVFKKIRLSYISIIDPSLRAERAEDGTLNVAPLVERIRSGISRSSKAGPSGYSVLLRSVTISNGRVEFLDRMNAARISVSGFTMTARVDVSQERARVVVREAEVRASTPAYPELAGKFRTTLEYNQGNVRIESAELSTADAALTVTGSGGMSPEAVLDLTVQLGSGPKAIR